ncbi:MAG TPA: hypothetical protein VNI58_06645 [Mariprofundaceae bacterium]|nr:hypothetical protein [Mariprofundaceae bacterium]
MPDMFEIEISCDNCGNNIMKSMRWIREHDELSCGCGRQIQLDAALFKSHIARVEHSFAGFQRSLDSFGS